MPFLLFFSGLFGLWLGSELTIRGALKIMQRFKVSATFIGLTILAIGTDLPEIFVAVVGAFENVAGRHTSHMILGNVVGSTMSQIGLVLGISGLFGVVVLKKQEVLKYGVALLIAVAMFYLFNFDGIISRGEGFIMLASYFIYFLLLNRGEYLHKHSELKKQKKEKRSLWQRWKDRGKNLFAIELYQLLGGVIIIILSSHLVLENGEIMAAFLGISETVVGIFMIGLGTSLPELAVSVNAALRGARELSIGNLIGSNIVDLMVVPGIASMISVLDAPVSLLRFDIPFLFILSAVVIAFLYSRSQFERKESLLLIALYLAYVGLKILGGV